MRLRPGELPRGGQSEGHVAHLRASLKGPKRASGGWDHVNLDSQMKKEMDAGKAAAAAAPVEKAPILELER